MKVFCEKRLMNFAIVVENMFVEKWITDIIDQFGNPLLNNLAFLVVLDKNNDVLKSNRRSSPKKSYFISGINALVKGNINPENKQFYPAKNEADITFITSQLHDKNIDCILNLTAYQPEDIIRIFNYTPNQGVFEFELLNDLLLRNFAATYYQCLDKHAIVINLIACFPQSRSVIRTAKIRNVHYIITHNVHQIIQVSTLVLNRFLNQPIQAPFPAIPYESLKLRHAHFLDPIKLFIRTFSAFCVNLYKSLIFADNWQIWVFKNSIQDIMIGKINSNIEFKIISENSNSYYADPFLYLKDGNKGVFLEEYKYGNSTGYLRYYDSMQKSIQPVKIKNHNISYHMSYPFLIEHNGGMYCIPESGEAKEVAIYKVTDDPTILVRKKLFFQVYLLWM